MTNYETRDGLPKEVDYRGMPQYKEGLDCFRASGTIGESIPESPYETAPSKTAWLVGWLDARSEARLGPKVVDWINDDTEVS